jgi:xanthosine utilization system XapX-like protein
MNIEQEIKEIRDRNRRVELDKEWETSWARRLLIGVVTYVVVVIWLIVIQSPRPWATALIPALGYVLSTLTIPVVKRWWMGER